MLQIIIAVAAVENLTGVCNMWGRGGRAGVHMNLMPPGVSKVSFFPIFSTFQAASSRRH